METCPDLFVISPPTVFLRSLAGEAILFCYIATAFLHKSNSSAVFFFDRHHFTQCLSRQIFFYSPTFEIRSKHFALYTDESAFAFSLVLTP